MPTCVHCSVPTPALYTSYGPNHIVCTRCTSCGAFADPYVEHEAILVGLDLILVKPRAYRHLLYNRFHPLPSPNKAKKNRIDAPSASWQDRFQHFLALVTMILIDSYLHWFPSCDHGEHGWQHSCALHAYWNILLATLCTTATLHISAMMLAALYVYIIQAFSGRWLDPHHELTRFRARSVSAALLIAHITPSFLRGLLFLWQMESLPHRSSPEGWRGEHIDWAIRTFVTGLSSGVALGVVIPWQRTRLGALAAILILLTAWTMEMLVSHSLGVSPHGGPVSTHTIVQRTR